MNKHNRGLRRDEIIARWKRRQANREFAAWLPRTDGSPDSGIVGLLHFGRWAPYEDLLEYTDPESLKPLLVLALRIIELKEMPYDEYLLTPEWKARANAAKRQFHGKCALDSTHSADDAHHRTYERRGREYPSDLIPLCRDCHSKFHGKR